MADHFFFWISPHSLDIEGCLPEWLCCFGCNSSGHCRARLAVDHEICAFVSRSRNFIIITCLLAFHRSFCCLFSSPGCQSPVEVCLQLFLAASKAFAHRTVASRTFVASVKYLDILILQSPLRAKTTVSTFEASSFDVSTPVGPSPYRPATFQVSMHQCQCGDNIAIITDIIPTMSSLPPVSYGHITDIS